MCESVTVCVRVRVCVYVCEIVFLNGDNSVCKSYCGFEKVRSGVAESLASLIFSMSVKTFQTFILKVFACTRFSLPIALLHPSALFPLPYSPGACTAY